MATGESLLHPAEETSVDGDIRELHPRILQAVAIPADEWIAQRKAVAKAKKGLADHADLHGPQQAFCIGEVANLLSSKKRVERAEDER